ncbi:hypothetical protein ACFZBU_24780 [Embleya sp. NPDC008237]|uniref:hypothetical protein n=1 Tax=Embleya sp. NPDC008237 TaxID=3363978 RepID=UPI0036EAAE60
MLDLARWDWSRHWPYLAGALVVLASAVLIERARRRAVAERARVAALPEEARKALESDRTATRDRRGRRVEDLLTAAVAAAAAGLSAAQLGKFGRDVMGLHGPWAYLPFVALDFAAVVCALRARRRAARGAAAGLSGALVWVLALLSASMSASEGANLGEAFALGIWAPIAAVLWELGLAEERHARTERADRRVGWIRWLHPIERVLVLAELASDEHLGAAEATERVRERRAARALYRLRQATEARAAQVAGDGRSAARPKRGTDRRYRRAEAFAQRTAARVRLADAAVEAAVLPQLRVLVDVGRLANMTWPTPDVADSARRREGHPHPGTTHPEGGTPHPTLVRRVAGVAVSAPAELPVTAYAATVPGQGHEHLDRHTALGTPNLGGATATSRAGVGEPGRDAMASSSAPAARYAGPHAEDAPLGPPESASPTRRTTGTGAAPRTTEEAPRPVPSNAPDASMGYGDPGAAAVAGAADPGERTRAFVAASAGDGDPDRWSPDGLRPSPEAARSGVDGPYPDASTGSGYPSEPGAAGTSDAPEWTRGMAATPSDGQGFWTAEVGASPEGRDGGRGTMAGSAGREGRGSGAPVAADAPAASPDAERWARDAAQTASGRADLRVGVRGGPPGSAADRRTAAGGAVAGAMISPREVGVVPPGGAGTRHDGSRAPGARRHVADMAVVGATNPPRDVRSESSGREGANRQAAGARPDDPDPDRAAGITASDPLATRPDVHRAHGAPDASSNAEGPSQPHPATTGPPDEDPTSLVGAHGQEDTHPWDGGDLHHHPTADVRWQEAAHHAAPEASPNATAKPHTTTDAPPTYADETTLPPTPTNPHPHPNPDRAPNPASYPDAAPASDPDPTATATPVAASPDIPAPRRDATAQAATIPRPTSPRPPNAHRQPRARRAGNPDPAATADPASAPATTTRRRAGRPTTDPPPPAPHREAPNVTSPPPPAATESAAGDGTSASVRTAHPPAEPPSAEPIEHDHDFPRPSRRPDGSALTSAARRDPRVLSLVSLLAAETDLTGKEIADSLGIAESSGERLLQQAREELTARRNHADNPDLTDAGL